MCPSCNARPIHSHVFQKNGILNKVAVNRKVYMFTFNHLFSVLANEPIVEYKLKGINDAFCFWGFCSDHDNKIFAHLEPANGMVNWYDTKTQYLLAYRCICRELSTHYDVKFILMECIRTFNYDKNSAMNIALQLSSRNNSIKVLNTYKSLFEDGIFNASFSKYTFKIIELPYYLELCVSAPIMIAEESAGLYFGPPKEEIGETINVVNIFPYKRKTMIIMGFLKNKPNKWMNRIYEMLSSNNIKDICFALQDILFRTEFHCISTSLYDAIHSEIPLFIEEYIDNMSNFNNTLHYTSNLFYRYLTTNV